MLDFKEHHTSSTSGRTYAMTEQLCSLVHLPLINQYNLQSVYTTCIMLVLSTLHMLCSSTIPSVSKVS